MDHGTPCRMLCLSLVPSKGHSQTLSPTLGLLPRGLDTACRGIRVKSQTLGTACPSALMLEAGAQEKNPKPIGARSEAWEHIFFFPRAGEGMRG